MSEALAHDLSPLGGIAIDDTNPCGESARYEPEFEQLEAELAKLESLKSEPVDWNLVVRLASDILRRKSKDLLVAVYLCQGLVQTEGYRGLAVGLKVVSDMVDRYWEPMFPPVKRLRARKAALEWLGEKASFYIGKHPPVAKDTDAIVQAAQLSRDLDNTLVEKMGGEAPGLTELTRPLKQFREAVKLQQVKAVPPMPSSAPVAPHAVPNPAPSAPAPREAPLAAALTASAATVPVSSPISAEIGEPIAVNVESEAEARKSLRQLQDGMRKVAAFLNKAKIADPKAYRLARTAAWMTIDQLPPHKEGVTQLPAPPADRRKQLGAMYEQSQFSALVPEIEQTLARTAFWLDGQRLVTDALKSMGAEYAAARETVIGEVRHFLGRLPGVTDLKFTDGTPFADDSTRMWIAAEVITSGKNESASSSSGAAATPWNEALAEARGLAASGKHDKAVGRFHAGIMQSGALREQFYWRTALSEFLIQSGNPAVAVQILEQMCDRIEQQRLDQWEFELVVSIYRRLFDAYQKLAAKKKGDSGLLAKIEHVYAKMCWLDPMTAITVKGD